MSKYYSIYDIFVQNFLFHMGLLVGFGDYGVGDIVQKADDLYQLLLELCQDQLSWENILNKPELYTKAEVYNKEEIDDKFETFEPGHHTHPISDITGLTAELAARYTKTETDDLLEDKADVEHTHEIEDVIGLADALSAFGVQIVSELPSTVVNGKVYILYTGGTRFDTFISAGGTYISLNAVTYTALATALNAYQTKLNGTDTQYVKGDGTYAELNKAAVGLSNVPNLSPANWPISTDQAVINAQKANQADVLLKAGSQTKTSGVLTFMESPVVPDPINSQDAANKGYIDGLVAESSGQVVFEFTSPAEEWVVPHNLNKMPDPIIKIGGKKVWSDIQYVDNDIIKIIHKKAQTGFVYIDK